MCGRWVTKGMDGSKGATRKVFEDVLYLISGYFKGCLGSRSPVFDPPIADDLRWYKPKDHETH